MFIKNSHFFSKFIVKFICFYQIMSLVKNSKEDMDFGFGSNTNQGMDKAIILQETKIFNETPLDVKMCCSVLAKVIYMIHVGETLGML